MFFNHPRSVAVAATSDYDTVCHLYCTRVTVNVMIMTLPYNNATVSTYKALCTSENDTEEMLLVLVMSLISPPPIRRMPAGELQPTWSNLSSRSW